jgi:hypothetical protein
MFELEMDVDKNHYETQSQLSERHERDELDDALRRLKELAERQERLAQQANRGTPTPQQRWQQEQLRREAEDLRRQLEELTRSQSAQSAQSASNSQSSQSQSARNGENSPAQGQPSGTPSAAALDSMRNALDEMRSANTDPDSRAATEAGRNLRRALDQMQQPHGESMADALDRLADRAQKLVTEQRAVEAELYDALGDAMGSAQQRGQLPPKRAQQLVESKQRMADDVNSMQRDMRGALTDHGVRNPQAAQRLGESLSDLEAANLAHRLERSAAEIRYGRARDAAPREGLIAEALDALERDLRVIAQVAANEAQGREESADPQRLLAEIIVGGWGEVHGVRQEDEGRFILFF